ncbi:MAG: hypothetical protein IJN95_04525 [Clostridia bacterium]|nr:hypothetical protein [Clostridia bacterium]
MKRKLLALFLVVAMLGVSLFAGLTTAGAENGAKAADGIGPHTYLDMENYANDKTLASFDAAAATEFSEDGAWRTQSVKAEDGTQASSTVKATTAKAHTGNVSVVADGSNNNFYGFKVTNLDGSTLYTVSFYAYIEGDATTTNEEGEPVQNTFKIDQAYAVAKAVVGGKEYDFIKNGKMDINNTILGKSYASVDATNKWARVEFDFNPHICRDSGKIDFDLSKEDIYIWFHFTGENTKLYVDDASVYKAFRVDASANFGGTVTSNLPTDKAIPGEEVVFTAQPLEGNTFLNWTDINGKVISTDKELKFTADDNYAYIANFEGPNKPSYDVLASYGFDGTFESYDLNATVPEWYVPITKGDSAGWYDFTVTDFNTEYFEPLNIKAAEGNKAMAAAGRFREVILPLRRLVPNTNYKLSFYVYSPDANPDFSLDNFIVTGRDIEYAADASSYFAFTRKHQSASGWYRIDMGFNSALSTSANFLFKFRSNIAEDGGKVYLDDVRLVAISGSEELANGDFEKGTEGWHGDVNVVADSGKNVLKLDADKSAFTSLLIKQNTSYEITFKAKGKGTSAALDASKSEVNTKNYITSVSEVAIDSADWKEYTYKFYSVNHNAFNLAFEAAAGGLLVDDVVVKESSQISGAIIEKIDFESERFALNGADSAFSYVEEDGNTVLKYTHDAESKVDHIFDQPFLSYQAPLDVALRISVRYKIADGKLGGAAYLAPEYSAQYGGETGFEQTAKTSDWQTAAFYITNTTHAAFKFKIAAMTGMTLSDFYVDDITISLTPPMVLQESTKITYCEELYNAIKNFSFEKKVTENDWANLPSNVKIVEGDALKGSHFLRATAGAHYVVPVTVEAGVEYTFGASIRGDKNTVGYVGLAINDEGSDFYVNRDDKPASRIDFDKEETGWSRNGFKITTDASGVAYLVVHVESGTLDIDSLMMFTNNYKYRYDPNDYTVYVPYDYDNLQSPTTVINGGFGEQPYYKPTKDK